MVRSYVLGLSVLIAVLMGLNYLINPLGPSDDRMRQ